MTFMPFECLFDGVNGGSFYLGTTFGVGAHNKWWQHLLNQERQLFGHAFAIFTKIFETKKGPNPFDPVVTQYYELKDETICIE